MLLSFNKLQQKCIFSEKKMKTTKNKVPLNWTAQSEAPLWLAETQASVPLFHFNVWTQIIQTPLKQMQSGRRKTVHFKRSPFFPLFPRAFGTKYKVEAGAEEAVGVGWKACCADRQGAGQWIYKGKRAFKNINEEAGDGRSMRSWGPGEADGAPGDLGIAESVGQSAASLSDRLWIFLHFPAAVVLLHFAFPVSSWVTSTDGRSRRLAGRLGLPTSCSSCFPLFFCSHLHMLPTAIFMSSCPATVLVARRRSWLDRCGVERHSNTHASSPHLPLWLRICLRVLSHLDRQQQELHFFLEPWSVSRATNQSIQRCNKYSLPGNSWRKMTLWRHLPPATGFPTAQVVVTWWECVCVCVVYHAVKFSRKRTLWMLP